MKFEKRITILLESVLDWPRDTLAPLVWEKSGKAYHLKPSLRQKIIGDLRLIPEKYKENIYLIGSICTYNYNDESDLDIHIIPPNEVSKEEIEEWQDVAKDLSKDFIGKHPINFYLHDPGESYYADSIYDIKNQKWIRWTPIKRVDLEDYYGDFKKVIDAIDLNRAELYRDIIDLEELRDAFRKASPMVRDDIEEEIESKIDEINDEIDTYIDTYADLKDQRADILGTGFPEKESRSSLPENVVFLLLRRYGYGQLAKALKDLRKEYDEIRDPKDMEEIKGAF